MFEDDKYNENSDQDLNKDLNQNENMTPEENASEEVPFEETPAVNAGASTEAQVSESQAAEAGTSYESQASEGQAAEAQASQSQAVEAQASQNQTSETQASEAQTAQAQAPAAEEDHGAKEPKAPVVYEEPRKQGGNLGKRIGAVIAAALLFGVVAGLTMFGVNSAATSISGRSRNTAVSESSTPHEDVTISHAETAAIPAVSAVAVDVSDIVENAMPSIVAIDNTMVIQQQTWFGRSQEYEAASSGSGIIVGQNDDELLIATNNHVVESSKDITVTFIDDVQVPAAVKGTDSEMDLAVIAVSLDDIDPETMAQIKVATIGNSDDLKVGEGVIAIGNALGYGQSVTVGVISALDREVKTEDAVTHNLLQTDAAINPGNSGGALLNMRGELIGINSAKYSGTAVEGMGYAIPISAAEDILNELMNKQTRVEVAENRQGYLGIQGTNIDDNTAAMYDMPRGVYVFKIMEGSAAASSDLHEKDIITKFDGQTVKTMAELKEMLTFYEAGTTVDLTVERLENGEYAERTVTITLGLRDAEEG